MSETRKEACPVCSREFQLAEIETHVNKCLFLNSTDNVIENSKRKRMPSPSNVQTQKSPKLTSPVFNKSRQSTSSSKDEEDQLQQSKELQKSSFDKTFKVPLAKQVVPKSLNDFYGQKQLLGSNSILHSLLEKGEIPNMILWGPPGCGKTSLASVVQEICKSNNKKLRFVSLNATNCGVKDVQNIVLTAKMQLKFGIRTVLFMDEVHRFNKSQQDTFLPCVEKGEIILIGATTENPSFRVNNALLSRCRVIVMEKLKNEDLLKILRKAANDFDIRIIDRETYDNTGFAIETSALEWLAEISDGDARIALSNLQLILQHMQESDKLLGTEDIKEGLKKSHMLYDRKGEEHYNIISAMHKSIRGSDPDAALYWTTRMIVSGEDPLFIARRMVRAASEDIGNADPNALQLAISTMHGCQLLGMPECDVLLAQCAIYLARAPKSREADSALAAAKRVITECKGPQPSVPMHIRNAPTKLMKKLGYGKLAENERRSFMPSGLENVKFL